MPAETFSLGAVLSVTTNRLLAPFDEVHRLIEHLAGEPVWTHQLPRVADEATPYLLAAHRALADVTVPGDLDGQEAVDLFLEGLGLPVSFDVEPMPREDHTSIDPVSELRMMAPGKPVIVIERGEPDAS